MYLVAYDDGTLTTERLYFLSKTIRTQTEVELRIDSFETSSDPFTSTADTDRLNFFRY